MTENMHTPQEEKLLKEMREALTQGGDPGKARWNDAVSKWRVMPGHIDKKTKMPLDNIYIDIEGVKAKDADLRGYNFRQVNLTGCEFTHCKFGNTTSENSQNTFERCHLTNNKLIDCDYTNVTVNRSTVDHTQFTGKGHFQDFRIQHSIVSNARIEGYFTKDPNNKDSYNAVNDNYFVNCTDIVRHLSPNEKPDADLLTGVMRVTKNTLPADATSQQKAAMHGVNHSSMVSLDANNKAYFQSLDTPVLGNEILNDEKKCALIVDGRYELTDYSVSPKLTFMQSLQEKIGYDPNASYDNLRKSSRLDGHFSPIGPGGLTNFGATNVPSIALGRQDHTFVGVTADFLGANLGKDMTLQTTDLGLNMTHMAGKNAYGDPSFKYQVSAIYTMGSVGISSKPVVPDSGTDDFGASYKAMTVGLGVGTWINRVGLNLGAKIAVNPTSNEEINKGFIYKNGLTTNDTYQVTTHVLQMPQNLNATVQYKLNSSPEYSVTAFVRGDLYTNTTIQYDAEVNRGGQPTVTHGLTSSGGVKGSAHIGISIGL